MAASFFCLPVHPARAGAYYGIKVYERKDCNGLSSGDYYDDTAGNMDYTRPMPNRAIYGPNAVVNIRAPP